MFLAVTGTSVTSRATPPRRSSCPSNSGSLLGLRLESTSAPTTLRPPTPIEENTLTRISSSDESLPFGIGLPPPEDTEDQLLEALVRQVADADDNDVWEDSSEGTEEDDIDAVDHLEVPNTEEGDALDPSPSDEWFAYIEGKTTESTPRLRSNSTRRVRRRLSFHDLPIDPIKRIFTFLRPDDWIRCRRVSVLCADAVEAMQEENGRVRDALDEAIRRRLHQQDARVTVVVRVRPSLLRYPPTVAKRVRTHGKFIELRGDIGVAEFRFDHCMDDNVKQYDMYQALRPRLRRTLARRQSICIFAYGQTGSGKTHTIFGTPEDPGIAPRLCSDVWNWMHHGLDERLPSDIVHIPQTKPRITTRQATYGEGGFLLRMSGAVGDSSPQPLPGPLAHLQGRFAGSVATKSETESHDTVPFTNIAKDRLPMDSLRMCVSGIQIYREQLSDMFIDLPGLHSLEVRGTHFEGKTIRRFSPTTLGQLHSLIRLAIKSRVTGATAFNNTSSRSHAIVTLHITCPKFFEHASLVHIVDLAGSERAGAYARNSVELQEGCTINRSLTTLGRVISSLASRSSHVPYRESTMTRLLEGAIAGGSGGKAFMVATVTPEHPAETTSTLQYASMYFSLRNPFTYSIRRYSQSIQSQKRRLTSLDAALAELAARLEAREARCRKSGSGVAVQRKVRLSKRVRRAIERLYRPPRDKQKEAFDQKKSERDTLKETLEVLMAKLNTVKGRERTWLDSS